MSTPPFPVASAPSIPPNWSQHTAPTGHAYYYNSLTRESTYVRPMPQLSSLPTLQPDAARIQREKPQSKVPIPGTDWLRVRTTAGNVFYFNKIKKQSLWTIPDEIRNIIDKFDWETSQGEQHSKDVTSDVDEGSREASERAEEIERVKEEVRGLVKRKAAESATFDTAPAKKSKVEDEGEGTESSDSEEDEEEEWQKEAAAQLAAEVEAEKKKTEEVATAKEVEQKMSTSVPVPERVDLSLDEAKALFKTLLREKEINPLYPWDTSLPKFVNDPRYVLLPSVSARREAFDEYCRERARELRESAVQREKAVADPKGEFEHLLREDVTSTRTTWNDFRKKWKANRRFYGWGRDDREREKRFKAWIKELGEKKKAMAQKAEADFFDLLRERVEIKEGILWKDVKRSLYDDSRYDAVGSSTLREELFETFAKGQREKSGQNNFLAQGSSPDKTIQPSSENKRERAVREREEKVRADMSKIEADIGRSRIGITKEEGERAYRSLLTDAVRDPQVRLNMVIGFTTLTNKLDPGSLGQATWDATLSQLMTDARFQSSLPLNQQIRLFHEHVRMLRSKHLNNLHALFQSHAPSLAESFESLPLPSLLPSLPVTKLGLDVDSLELEFNKWQQQRTVEARKAFDEMLTENSFVEFWGRLGKLGGSGVDSGIKNDDLGEDEEERVDMKALAKSVNLDDMVKVLKNDQRYIKFDHVPEQRERWLREYLGNLTAPKLSVHVPS